MIKVSIEGSLQKLELNDKDFIHAGGEGSVYIKGDIAFKIYHDPSKSLEIERVRELQKIDCPNVVKPEKTLYDMSGKPIGYTMKALNNVWALTRLFNKSFRAKNAVTDSHIVKLIDRLRVTYSRLHELGFLVTDGNELNFMVGDNFTEIYFIDVDAYKTPSYPSRAYNEATLDPNLSLPNLKFDEESDWFAYAIITSQLLTGIHPFKGIYEGKKYKFGKNDIPARISHRISYFNKDVRLARPIIPLDSIPSGYKDWFNMMFETDNRSAPPATFSGLKSSKLKLSTKISSILSVTKEDEFPDAIECVYTNGTKLAIKTVDYFSVSGSKFKFTNPDSEMIFLPETNKPILLKTISGFLVTHNTSTGLIEKHQMDLRSLFVYSNRVYGISQNALLEISFKAANSKLKAFSDVLETLNPGSATQYDGIVIERLLGGTHASILIEQGQCAKLHLKDFDDKRIINAKYENNVLALVYYDRGNYKKVTYKIDRSYRKLKLVSEVSVESQDIQLAVLAQGVAISLEEDLSINIFSNKFSQEGVNTVSNAYEGDDLTIFSNGTQLKGYKGKALYGLSLS